MRMAWGRPTAGDAEVGAAAVPGIGTGRRKRGEQAGVSRQPGGSQPTRRRDGEENKLCAGGGRRLLLRARLLPCVEQVKEGRCRVYVKN